MCIYCQANKLQILINNVEDKELSEFKSLKNGR